VRRVPWSLDANWKVAIENYLECYHCSTAHPGLAKLFDVRPDAYELHEHERFSFQVGPPREGRPPGSFIDAGEIPRAQWHWAWPNLTVNVEPGAQNLSIDAWFPAGPHRTEGVTDYFFGADVPEALAEEVMAFSRQVGEEDALLVASVQRGLASAMVPEVNPTTTMRPSKATQRREPSKTSPPTGSKTTSAPRPFVASLTASTKFSSL